MKTVSYDEFIAINYGSNIRKDVHPVLVASGLNAGLCNRLQHDVPIADALNLFSNPDDKAVVVAAFCKRLDLTIDTAIRAMEHLTSLRASLLVERGRWPTTHAAQHAISDALDALDRVARCVADINDEPITTTEEEFAKSIGALSDE